MAMRVVLSQSELGSSATPSADNPIGFTKRLRDMRTLDVLECPCLCDGRGSHILCHKLCRLQVYRPYVKDRARGHDHSALDDILQFPDIARPIDGVSESPSLRRGCDRSTCLAA